MPKRFAVGACLVLGLVLVLSGAAGADEEAAHPEKPKPPPTWQELAAQEGMTPEDVQRLGRNKVLIGVRTFPQIFSAYVQFEALPVFVTTDSVLRAYNVLLEESLSRVEAERSRRLKQVLRSIWPGLASAMPADAAETMPERDRAAVRRAQVVIGVALALLGEATPGVPPGVTEGIRKEVRLVEAGVGRRRPPWLDTSDDLIHVLDYDRFRPRGLHTATEARARGFRATAWLQDVPFDLERDGDVQSIATLLGCFGDWTRWRDAPDEAWQCRDFVEGLDDFLGAPRRPSVFSARPASSLDALSGRFGGEDGVPRVVHVLPRYETPDAALLARLFDERVRRGTPFRLPGGSDLIEALASADWPEPVTEEGLFGRYLRLLRHLLDEPDPAAPALFRGDAWRRKSTQTALGAWAQIRHAWALAAMDPQKYFCDMKPPPGWVEPEPDFFLDLLELAIDTETTLRERGAFDPAAAWLEQVAELAWCVARFDELEGEGALKGGYDTFFAALGDADVRRFQRRLRGRHYFWEACNRIRAAEAESGEKDLSRAERQAWVLREEMQVVREEIEAFEKKRGADPDWRSRVRDPVELARRWEALQRLLGRLSRLASKQLRGVPFDARDATFLRTYAKRLAYPMLYDGNAFMNPPPDRPLVASVFSAYPPTAQPRPDEAAQVVHAGLGMPVAIYVLWPHEGREVLCRGGVMPYYETVESTRSTDEAWAERLRSDDPPQQPAWVRPITAPIRPRPPRSPR